MVLLGLISLVHRGSVSANDGAVTFYAQYGRTLHARAAAEPRNHMAGTVDCDSRRAFGSVTYVLLCLCLIRPGRHPKNSVFENSGGRI